MELLDWAARLEASPLGEWMRSSALAYPITNVIHLLGLVLLVGPILLLDLRLLGAARHIPLLAIYSLLTRWSAAGLTLLTITGFAMFAADAEPLLGSSIMQFKLIGIALGVSNAVAFRLIWQRRISAWDDDPPQLGRLQAGASILLWLTVATLGRWIAYA